LHYWIRLPGSHIREGCQTESECEDDYLADNPDVAAIDLIFSWNLGIKSILLTKSAEALTRQGQVKITTASLAGSVFVETPPPAAHLGPIATILPSSTTTSPTEFIPLAGPPGRQ
jgi:hypothetical protein